MTESAPRQLLEKWIIATSLVVLVVVGAYAVKSRGQVVTKATPSNLSAGLAAIGDRVTAELKPAEGQSATAKAGQGSGQVVAERSGEETILKVTAVLPELPDNAFYQVWFIHKDGDPAKPGRLGRLTSKDDCGCWVSEDHLSLSPSDITSVRITQEQTDDETSEKTILEEVLTR